jgi:hemoglobin
MPQTLYAFAGGHDAIRRLAHAHYRRCLEDPLLSQVFGAGSPTHADHLADWLAEVLGGPPHYTEQHGGHEGLLRHHAGRRITEPQRARFVEVFLAASDEAGLPADPRFRERVREYLEWGTAIAVDVSRADPEDISSDEPVPVWDWGPQGAPTSS